MPIGGPDELIELLGNTPVVLRQVADGMEAESASKRDADGWSTVEIVGHLIDVERRSIDRIAVIMAEENPTVTGYDPDEMVNRQGYQDQVLDDLLPVFETLRSERLSVLTPLDRVAWQRGCSSEGVGAMSLLEITTHSCNHDVNHIAQIARLRKEME